MKCQTLLLVLCCVGLASARRQLRRAENFHYQYPSMCNLAVAIRAHEYQTTSWSGAPVITGSVTVTNPNPFPVPIVTIVIQAVSSDGMRYAGTATCTHGGPNGVVPYEGGSLACDYRIQLDRRVFGSYGSDSSSSSNGVMYFASSDSRPSWTVQAFVNFGIPIPQCTSAPLTIETDSWWQWLHAWWRTHYPSLRVVVRSGRRLFASPPAAEAKDLSPEDIQRLEHFYANHHMYYEQLQQEQTLNATTSERSSNNSSNNNTGQH